MFRNSWILAWRHLVKNRQFTLLNLAGLAIGLASAITIFWWVGQERCKDAFLDPRLYQVMQNIPLDNGGTFTTESTPIPLAPALKSEFPEIADVAIVKFPDPDGNSHGIITAGRNSLKAVEAYVTPNFLSLFHYRLIQGDAQQAFAPGNRVLLSAGLANRLFHTTDNLIGKPITWSRGDEGKYNGSFTIAGIYASPPVTATTQYDILFPHAIYAAHPDNSVDWLSSSPATYVVLKPGADPGEFNKKIQDYIRDKYKAGSQERAWAAGLFAQRVKDRYLYNRYENGRIAGGRIDYIRLFSLIAVFVLVIACINFMNLSTANAIRRLKEVGIQKVVGANRSVLIVQYMGEAILMSFLAATLALGLIGLLRPGIEAIIGGHLAFHPTGANIAALLGITLLTGVLAGSYPALYISRFSPMSVLKGSNSTPRDTAWLRQSLVVLQFVISTGFIVAVFTIYRQMSLIQNRDLGYNREHIIQFPSEGAIGASQQAFLTQLRTIPGVIHAADVEGDLLGNHSGGGGIDWPGKVQRVEFAGVYAGFGYMETMGLRMQAGRVFSRAYPTDTTAVIFNEAAITAMHLENPVGKTVTMWGAKRHIIGVVKDFHYESLYKHIGPFFIALRPNNPNILACLQATSEKSTLTQIQALYKKYNPGLPFEYSFISEDYKTLYAPERQLSLLSRYFAGIAIGISCLGLFGLTAFSAERRRKEIGIRKVIGASVHSLLALLATGFLKLIGIAVCIAFPLTWWLLNRWLDGFAYRAHLGAGIFLTAAGSVVIITLLTISFQSIKAALANPIKSLRTE
ncbi:MAG TPA: ABC transporter permease [Puia sp.]|uniref:ABC transporter permease n=1 Tax=Puia sp. TaxID=2045100 RepID=UPI002CB2FFE5|nr:ABC transporter permease [Puia sp.]HVU98363.1 ABC transporter permease [Puia sp.]